MEIKKLQTSPIQEKASTETSATTTNSILQKGVGSIQDGFNNISAESKLFADDEISSAQGSRDLFQTVDQPATHELGSGMPVNNKSLSRHKKNLLQIQSEKQRLERFPQLLSPDKKRWLLTLFEEQNFSTRILMA